MIDKKLAWILLLAVSVFWLARTPGRTFEAAPPDVSAGLVTFNVTTLTLTIGDIVRVGWMFTPADSTTTVTLLSSIPTVATIDEDGTISALSEGMTLLSLETEDGRRAYLPLRVKILNFRPG